MRTARPKTAAESAGQNVIDRRKSARRAVTVASVSGSPGAAGRADRLSATATAWVHAALATGDPQGEVTAAWLCAQDLARAYLAPSAAEGRRRALATIEAPADLPGARSPTAGLHLALLTARVPCLRKPDN